MSGDSKFYLKASSADRPRTLPRAEAARASVRGVVDGRIVVRRPRTRRVVPPWLKQSVLTTAIIATIGFALQRLLLPSPAAPGGFTAIGAVGPTSPDRGAQAPAALPLAVLAPDQQAFKPISREAAISLNASIPFSTAPVRAAAPFVLNAASEQDRERAIDCLTQAIYYEAGGDTVDDQRAVAQVILNRVRHPVFPKSVCGVVFQGSSLKTGCQFTFTCDGSLGRVPDARGLARARGMAMEALSGAVFAPVGYATHFHTPWVAPYWAPTLQKIVQVGGHLFYRLPGALGAPGAFNGGYSGSETVVKDVDAVPAGMRVADAAAAHPAPPVKPQADAAATGKLEVASIDVVVAAPLVDVRVPLTVVAPAKVALDGVRVAARAYHPPIPRGGAAQPLMSGRR